MNGRRRRDTYRLLGGLLAEGPRDEPCRALVADATLKRLGESVGGALGAALVRMHAELAAGAQVWAAIRRDYVALFVGPKKKLAPPWESVYRSPERLMMQAPEREVVRAYAAERIGFEGMGRLPADHVALELQFCAVMCSRARAGREEPAALRRFLDEHLLAWVPAFAADVGRNAKTEFFRAVADALEALCELEAGAPAEARAASAGGPAD